MRSSFLVLAVLAVGLTLAGCVKEPPGDTNAPSPAVQIVPRTNGVTPVPP